MQLWMAAALAVGLLLSARAAAAQDRWQLTLEDGTYLYELRPVSLRGDSLVIEQEGRTRTLPLAQLHELREVRPALQPAGTRRGTFAGLTGAADRVYVVGYLSPDERRRVVLEIVQARSSRSSPEVGTPTIWGAP